MDVFSTELGIRLSFVKTSEFLTLTTVMFVVFAKAVKIRLGKLDNCVSAFI
jgi:hypothetical protein